jgi:hypothetical protein
MFPRWYPLSNDGGVDDVSGYHVTCSFTRIRRHRRRLNNSMTARAYDISAPNINYISHCEYPDPVFRLAVPFF